MTLQGSSAITPAAPSTVDLDDLSELLPDWLRHLRSTNHSPATLTRYRKDAIALVAYLRQRGMPTVVHAVAREHLEAFFADELSRPRRRAGKTTTLSPATVAGCYKSLQQWWRWMRDEDLTTADPFARMRPPRVPETPVPFVPDDHVEALLKACRGTDFASRRDTAIIRVLFDTGVRSSELLGLSVDDLDFDTDVAMVLGKGRRPRAVPFDNRTPEALRRYLQSGPVTRAHRPLHCGWARRVDSSSPGCGSSWTGGPLRPVCRTCTLISSGTARRTLGSRPGSRRVTLCG